MQRYTSSRYERNTTPRPAPSSKPDLPVMVNTKDDKHEEMPPGFAYSRPSQLNPLPIVLLILYASPYIKKGKTSPSSMDSNVNSTFEEADTILDMLSSVHPYLDPEYQNGINFIFGLYEVGDVLNRLSKGIYQTPRILNTIDQPINYQEKAVGIIKSLQPYISLENQVFINRILDVNDTIEKLRDNVRKYREQETSVQDSKEKNFARVIETIDIIKILIPPEQQQSISQISKILKVIEALEITQLLNTPKKSEVSSDDITKNMAEVKDNSPSDDKEPVSESEKISNALKSALGPEQAKSLDLIMKMAQLFSQNSEEQNSAG